MKAKDRRLAELKSVIQEIEPREAHILMARGAVILDVRELDEISQGSPTGALRIPKGRLEMDVEEALEDFEQVILVLCAAGLRSLFAAESLLRLGYVNVASVRGGFSRWKSQGLDFEIPPMLDAEARQRYARHLRMPQVGEQGQLKLLNARVLCVGAGGLGSPAALYLAAAGVGTLGIVDHDVVDRSNLQRQILHGESSLGRPKVDSAEQRLRDLNPAVKVITYPHHLSEDNVDTILDDYDLVIDGSDNIPTRYLINDACVRLGIPNVHGAVFRFEGQVTVFWPAAGGPCYRCLFPAENSEPAMSCAQAGVLGVLPGVIGLLQAVEAVKLILQLGEPLVGRMLYYDALDASFRGIGLKPRAGCSCCTQTGVAVPQAEELEPAL